MSDYQKTSPQAQIKVKTKRDNVAGVNLPNFEAFQVNLCFGCFFNLYLQDGSDTNELAGLAKGGQQLKRLKVIMRIAVLVLLLVLNP